MMKVPFRDSAREVQLPQILRIPKKENIINN